jgi:hypothetical protein
MYPQRNNKKRNITGGICGDKHNETHQTLFDKPGGRRSRYGDIMEVVNLFKVH